MTCRHGPGDYNCSKNSPPVYTTPATPNPSKYEILDVVKIGNNTLVMKVKYESCIGCAFDAQKVMVFLNVDVMDAFKWNRIDPHFSDKKRSVREAPSPSARFPATPLGWSDALKYAKDHSDGGGR